MVLENLEKVPLKVLEFLAIITFKVVEYNAIITFKISEYLAKITFKILKYLATKVILLPDKVLFTLFTLFTVHKYSQEVFLNISFLQLPAAGEVPWPVPSHLGLGGGGHGQRHQGDPLKAPGCCPNLPVCYPGNIYTTSNSLGIDIARLNLPFHYPLS